MKRKYQRIIDELRMEMITIIVFGITGTNGKTSTSYMLRHLLWQDGENVALIGTITHNTGKSSYSALNTTPSKELLRKYFMEMKEKSVDSCIMEVSSHGIAQDRIEEVAFSYGGFTNLSRDHLDYHGDMESYFNVKKSFFHKTLKGDAVNIDDDYGKRLFDYINNQKNYMEKMLYTVSTREKNASVYGEIIEENISGTTFELFLYGKSIGKAKLSMMGRASLYNMLLAIALYKMEKGDNKRSEDIIIKGIESFEGVPGRYELLGGGEKPYVVVDYAHTPEAMEKLLQDIRRTAKGRIITIFGCGGNRDRGKRPMMGEIAGRLSDYCIITSDNPRNENPMTIIEEIEAGIKRTNCHYSILPGRYQAISRGIFVASKDDIIVVAGKGHETYPFSDKEVVEELL